MCTWAQEFTLSILFAGSELWWVSCGLNCPVNIAVYYALPLLYLYLFCEKTEHFSLHCWPANVSTVIHIKLSWALIIFNKMGPNATFIFFLSLLSCFMSIVYFLEYANSRLQEDGFEYKHRSRLFVIEYRFHSHSFWLYFHNLLPATNYSSDIPWNDGRWMRREGDICRLQKETDVPVVH